MIFSNNTDIGYTFYNDRVNEIVDASLIAEPFTYVPIVAGHMEVVGGNAIVFGDITEGEDIIEPHITPSISYTDVESNVPRINFAIGPVLVPPIVYTWPDPHVAYEIRTLSGVVEFYIPSPIYANSVYYLVVTNKGVSITGSFTTGVSDTQATVATGLKNSLISHGVLAADVKTVVGVPGLLVLYPRSGDLEMVPDYQSGDINTIYSNLGLVFSAYVLTYGFANKYADIKCGASHGFGIVYKDRAGRQCSVVKFDPIYIPFYTEDTDNLLEAIVNLQFAIYNDPPSWAETYEIVYFGNNTMDEFLQLREDQVTKLTLGTDRYSLNIASTISWAYDQNNRWKVSGWTHQYGDRIRLIGTIDPSTGVITKYTSLYDYEIEETADQMDDTIKGDWFIFQAKNHPADLDAGVSR